VFNSTVTTCQYDRKQFFRTLKAVSKVQVTEGKLAPLQRKYLPVLKMLARPDTQATLPVTSSSSSSTTASTGRLRAVTGHVVRQLLRTRQNRNLFPHFALLKACVVEQSSEEMLNATVLGKRGVSLKLQQEQQQ
jgi:hypothetical protein